MPDTTGTITTGGTAQQILPANPLRKRFFVQNNSAGALTVSREGNATATGPIVVPAGAMYESPVGMPTDGKISIYGATTGQAFGYGEF